MKTKYLFLILVAGIFVANIKGQTGGMPNITWYILSDTVYWDYIKDDFDTEYLPFNAYVTEIPVQTSVNEQGAAMVNVPLALPDVGNGLKPDLALHYNSMQSGSMFGNDWTLSGLSEISRARKNIYYDNVTRGIDTDVDIDGTEAFSLNGNRLIVLSNDFPNSVNYQSETGNIKVKAHFIQRKDSLIGLQLRYAYSHFEVFYPNGKTAVFGFENLEQNKSLLDFPITKISDLLGNEVRYSYIFSYGEYRISKIEFGKNHIASIDFFYKEASIPFLKKYIRDKPIDILIMQHGGMGPTPSHEPKNTALTTNCILSGISVKYNNQDFHDYSFTYHSDGKRIFLNSIQLIKKKNENNNAVNNIPESGSGNNSAIVLQNDTTDFSMPLRFRYGENRLQTLYSSVSELNPLDTYTEYKSKKAVFGNNRTLGTVIYPGIDMHNGFTCPENAEIGIKTDLNKPETYTLSAGAGFVDILCVDVDSICGDEIIKINNYISGNKDILEFSVYTVNSSGELKYKYAKRYKTAFKIANNSSHPIYKEFFSGDFVGNGWNQILAVSSLKPDYSNYFTPFAELYDLSNDFALYQDALFANIQVENKPNYSTDPNKPVYYNDETNKIRLITGDFNDNGITDLVYLPLNNRFAALIEFDFDESGFFNTIKKLGSDFSLGDTNNTNFLTGDFNGDGKTDLFSTEKWHVYLSDGKNLTYKPLGLHNNSNGLYVYSSTEDMNGDGHSDLTFIHQRGAVETYFFADGEIVATDYSYQDIPSGYKLANGNFMGTEVDHNEVLLVYSDSIVRLSFGLNLSKEALLTGVKSGLGTATHFEYSTLDSAAVYTQTQDMLFPYQNLSRSSAVVSKMRTHYQDEAIDVKTYTYENGVTHKQGLDFCGFEKVSVLDSIRNQSVVKTFDPLNYGILKKIESPVAKAVNIYNVDIAENKIAKITLESSAQTDKLRNTTVNKSYLYDSYGNVSKETINFGDGIKQITDNTYNNFDTGTLYRLGELASTGTTNYAPINSNGEELEFDDTKEKESGGIVLEIIDRPIINKKGVIAEPILAPGDTQSHFDGLTVSISAKTDILYNNKGLPTQKTSYYNGNKVSEATSNYSNFGDLLSLGAKPYNETASLEKSFKYDAHGRLIKETDPANNSIEYYYNNKGQLEESKDIYGHITAYEYDRFGRLTTTTSPLGSITNVKHRWIDPANNSGAPSTAIYAITTTTKEEIRETLTFEQTGTMLKSLAVPVIPPTENDLAISATAFEKGILAPKTTVYFDALGREIRSEQERFDGSILKIDNQYDSRGRLWKVSLPFKDNAPTLWNIYSYDEFDRPTNILYASGKQDTWIYDGNSVTTTVDGITSTKICNAAGQVIEVNDAGGTIKYQYRPDGQVEKIITNGVKTSFTYDNYGRQLTITDPSAGTETLTYDSRGNIATLKDAKNQTSSFVYDALYRLTAKQMPEYSVHYGYDPKGNLNSINSNNGQSLIAYAFDDYGRLSAETETFEGKTLQKQYGYSNDRLSSKTYRINNVEVASESFLYQNGYHTETKLNDSKSIWKITAENERGQTTTAKTGNFTRTYGFDTYGMPTLRKMQQGNTVIQNFAYNFDASTGNLLSRTDNTRGMTESFEYDELNRLTDFGGKSMFYEDNGNILEKEDLSYVYNVPKSPYAVSEISNFPSPVPQEIEYTSFKRPFSIENDDIRAEFAYNGLDNRSKLLLSETKNKIYLNNCYEKDQNAGNTKEKLYLCGDYYTSHAVMIRENNNAWQLYYIGRDYLGSITHVVHENSNAVHEYSYDAWGNLRNPDTHAVYAQYSQPDLFLGRGFTGHEHLSFCGLINMNARLYDPVVGRFLSPDPYVQSPDFTQSYNRYSYCWNNPLKYIDTDGKKSYTYNYRTQQYEDENGNWAPWSEVDRWLNNSYSFKDPRDYASNVSAWGIGITYDPGYVYFNPATGQIRYLDTSGSIMGALLKTKNASGNFPDFTGHGIDHIDDWLTNISITTTSLKIDATALENTWRLIGKRNQQTLAYNIQKTVKPHGVRLKTATIKTNIGSGFKVAGKAAGVASGIVTGVQIYNDVFNEGEYYSAGARALVWSAAAGATFIPVAGWGVAIGIGIADIIWGEQFYSWVETQMK